MKLDFLELSERELFEIWKSTNAYEWNDLLGPKPDGFDALPALGKRKNQRCKSDYTKPIWNVVTSLIGSERLEKLRYAESSSFGKALELLVKFAPPGSKTSDLEPILEHFYKILDS